MEDTVEIAPEAVIPTALQMVERGTSLYTTLRFVESQLGKGKLLGPKQIRNIGEEIMRLVNKQKFKEVEASEAILRFESYFDKL